VRFWLAWILTFALGLVAARWNLTPWAIGACAIALFVVLVVDLYERHLRRSS